MKQFVLVGTIGRQQWQTISIILLIQFPATLPAQWELIGEDQFLLLPEQRSDGNVRVKLVDWLNILPE